MKYYTYAYLREDRTPYYIGKGQGNRAYIKRYGKGRAKRPKNLNNIILLKQNLTEEEAFKHEIYMISVFGRKDLGTGILHNRTDGGEGHSGYKKSEEEKENLRIKSTGRTHSEETKIQMSEAHKDKTMSKDHIEKIKKTRLDLGGRYEYDILSPSNENYKTNNLKQFCRENNLHSSHMYAICRGKLKHHKGWKVTRRIGRLTSYMKRSII